jgi:hypothetical protein
MPRIISSGSGQADIDEIKRYFCSEYTLMRIADVTGMDYEVLINGQYKILLEPIAYMTFQGVKMAMTATEAALFDRQLDGGRGVRWYLSAIRTCRWRCSWKPRISDIGLGWLHNQSRIQHGHHFFPRTRHCALQ